MFWFLLSLGLIGISAIGGGLNGALIALFGILGFWFLFNCIAD